MSARDTHLTQAGSVVQELLDKMEDIGPVTADTDGLMSRYDKRKLDDDVPDRPLTNLEIEAILNT